MIAESAEDIKHLKAVGRIVALAIEGMANQVKPGMTTAELDDIGGRILKDYGAESAPYTEYGFPGMTCISLNEEAAHGIPGDRVIQPGDVINIDVSAQLNGYYADAGRSFQLPPYNPQVRELCKYTYKTMMKVIASLTAGTPLNTIGKVIQKEAKAGGYHIVRNLCSHGIGRALHEEPSQILPFYNPHDKFVLKEGQVLTIEPFLSIGADSVEEQADGWTLCVPEGSWVAQHEHTIIITNNKPIIVTALS